MPVLFSQVCLLLQSLEDIELKHPPLLPRIKKDAINHAVRSWFSSHRRSLDAPDNNGPALLSCLFPESRTDRVYGLQVSRLSKLIPRCLFMNAVKVKQLELYKIPGNGDFSTCLERALQDFDCEPKPGSLNVLQVDRAMEELAAPSEFSSPEVRQNRPHRPPIEILRPLYMKCKSFEAKWLTRLILKDFTPVHLNTFLIQSSYHFLLPFLLKFSDSFEVACTNLCGPLKKYPSNPDSQSRLIFQAEAAKRLQPVIGVKIARPFYHQARSIEQCLKWCSGGRWSVERKMDGEYCEIHVDMSKSVDKCIKTFSKRGKDSTHGLSAVHETVRHALKIGQSSCKFKERCIVIGELMVYDDKEGCIAPFHKIRKHVSRGNNGKFLGSDEEGQPPAYEHLMIVFHDILLLDSKILLNKAYIERRKWLRAVIKKQQGRAMTSARKILDFSDPKTPHHLLEHFATALAERAEGLVLKPADQPYVHVDTPPGSNFKGIIKLKKDYMALMGEERDHADFAIVGASYDSEKSTKIAEGTIKWTDFYLGCLKNPEDVRFGRKPLYVIVGCVSARERCIPPADLRTLNQLGQFREIPFSSSPNLTDMSSTIEMAGIFRSKPEVIFKEPFVAEVLGSGFEKLPGQSFYMLRFPRILKLHEDRDCVTFEALQSLAEQARSAPQIGEKEETRRLLELMDKEARKRNVRTGSATTSPKSTSTCKTTSPLCQTPNSKSSSERAVELVDELTPCPTRVEDQENLPSLVTASTSLRNAEYLCTDISVANPCEHGARTDVLANSNARVQCEIDTKVRSTVVRSRLAVVRQRSRKRLSEEYLQRECSKKQCDWKTARNGYSSLEMGKHQSDSTTCMITSCSALSEIKNLIIAKEEVSDSLGLSWNYAETL